MLRRLFNKDGIAQFLSKVRLAGMTVSSHLAENRANTKRLLKDLFKRMVMADVPAETFAQSLGKLVKARKRHTLSTLKNIMSAIRGRGRAILSMGQKGTWYNRGILDSHTTDVCASHMGRSWRMTYSDIPNKPPRVPPAHPCRSFLTFVKDGDTPPDERAFMEQFNENEALQLELLGKQRYRAFKQGKLQITSFAQYEHATLKTLKELGL